MGEFLVVVVAMATFILGLLRYIQQIIEHTNTRDLERDNEILELNKKIIKLEAVIERKEAHTEKLLQQRDHARQLAIMYKKKCVALANPKGSDIVE